MAGVRDARRRIIGGMTAIMSHLDVRPSPSPLGGASPLAPVSRRSFKADVLALYTSRTGISAYVSQLEWLAITPVEDTIRQNIVLGILSAPGSDGCRCVQLLNDETSRRLTCNLGVWIDNSADNRQASVVKRRT